MATFATKKELVNEVHKVQIEIRNLDKPILEIREKMDEIGKKIQDISFNMPKECNPLIINDMVSIAFDNCSSNWIANIFDNIQNNLHTSVRGMVHAYPEDKDEDKCY